MFSEWGGGIWIGYDSNPTITNCTFDSNHANRSGGAVFIKESSNPTITGCVFSNNTAVESAGGMNNTDCTPILTNSSFCNNTPNTMSGKLSADSGNNVIYTDCAGSVEVDELMVGHALPYDFYYIQTAINFTGNGDTIVVNPGTYAENINMQGKAVTLQSSDPADPSVVLATVIDGSDAGSVVTCGSGEDPNTIISGFMIKNGTAENGGGMYIYYSSPTIANCTFTANVATARGGGMYTYHSSPMIFNSIFTGNTVPADTGRGGGMCHDEESSPTITNCMISANTGFIGGGIYNYYSSPVMVDCFLRANTAYYGGGMFNSHDSLTADNCTFSGNRADDYGGAIYNEFYSKGALTNCTLAGNVANGLYHVALGGGIYNIQSSGAKVTDCKFVGNISVEGNGGGIYNEMSSGLTITSSYFCSNSPNAIIGDYTNGGGNLSYCPPPSVGLEGDVDGDGDVDFEDFAKLAANWLEGAN